MIYIYSLTLLAAVYICKITVPEYQLKIYDEENELITKANSISFFLEAMSYKNERFYGYNLLMYTDGEYELLATYEDPQNMKADRIRLENAIRTKEKEIYIFEG